MIHRSIRAKAVFGELRLKEAILILEDVASKDFSGEIRVRVLREEPGKGPSTRIGYKYTKSPVELADLRSALVELLDVDLETKAKIVDDSIEFVDIKGRPHRIVVIPKMRIGLIP